MKTRQETTHKFTLSWSLVQTKRNCLFHHLRQIRRTLFLFNATNNFITIRRIKVFTNNICHLQFEFGKSQHWSIDLFFHNVIISNGHSTISTRRRQNVRFFFHFIIQWIVLIQSCGIIMLRSILKFSPLVLASTTLFFGTRIVFSNVGRLFSCNVATRRTNLLDLSFVCFFCNLGVSLDGFVLDGRRYSLDALSRRIVNLALFL